MIISAKALSQELPVDPPTGPSTPPSASRCVLMDRDVLNAPRNRSIRSWTATNPIRPKAGTTAPARPKARVQATPLTIDRAPCPTKAASRRPGTVDIGSRKSVVNGRFVSWSFGRFVCCRSSGGVWSIISSRQPEVLTTGVCLPAKQPSDQATKRPLSPPTQSPPR